MIYYLLGILLYCFSASSWSYGMSRWNLPDGITPITHEVYDLHMLIFYVCLAIAVVVYAVFFYSLIKFQKKKGAVAAKFTENLPLEITWTVIPLLILLAMAFPATYSLMNIDNTQDADLTLKIIGSQWKWEYQYLDDNVHLFSDLGTSFNEIYNEQKKSPHYLRQVTNKLVLPAQKKIRLLLTSDDVIHSWWVSQFGLKKDAIPGVINEAWVKIEKPGIYRGQCAELCGRGHAFMPIVVDVKTPKEFSAWIAKKKQEKKTADPVDKQYFKLMRMVRDGRKNYGFSCAMCHGPDGHGEIPLIPALKGDSVATGYPINRQIDIVLKGIPGSAMPAFYYELSNYQLASILTYERNAWGNDTGEIVQPMDVARRRLFVKKPMAKWATQ